MSLYPRLALLTYDFPHKKTQDFIFRLLIEKIDISAVIAAPQVDLKISQPIYRTKIRYTAIAEPRKLARAFDFPYYVSPHNSPELPLLISTLKIEAGIIAGARILRPHIIDAFPKGIVNFHPGLLPDVRGLNALLRSILLDVPLGVTSHLISPEIDAGRIIIKQPIPIFEDDTLLDLTARLHDLELDLLKPTLDHLAEGFTGYPISSPPPYFSKMTPEEEHEAVKRLPAYILKYAKAIS